LKKIVLFKIGSKEAQLPKTIGAFLMIISLLMLFSSGALMFDSWQTVKGFEGCVDDAYEIEEGNTPELSAILTELKFQDCKDSLYQVTGAQIPGGAEYLTMRQKATAFLGPVSLFLGWAIVFLFALFLFNSATVVVPVEQIEISLSKPKTKSKRKRK
jgi:hypothetical protein